MAEFAALVCLKHKFGAPWRPIEQASVERIHQEVQKILGIMTQEVFKTFPDEWTEIRVFAARFRQTLVLGHWVRTRPSTISGSGFRANFGMGYAIIQTV